MMLHCTDVCLSVVTSLILTITHSVASSLPLGSRNVRFLHVAFDSAGERFIAGDCQGNVFLFDIRGNRYDKLITLFISISHMGVTDGFYAICKHGLCCRLMSISLSVMLVYCIHMAEDFVKLLFRPGSPIILPF